MSWTGIAAEAMAVNPAGFLVEYFFHSDKDRCGDGAFENSIEAHTYLEMEVQSPWFLLCRGGVRKRVVLVCKMIKVVAAPVCMALEWFAIQDESENFWCDETGKEALDLEGNSSRPTH